MDDFLLILASCSMLPYTAQCVPVAQLDRALPSEGKGYMFESRRGYYHQLIPVEHHAHRSVDPVQARLSG